MGSLPLLLLSNSSVVLLSSICDARLVRVMGCADRKTTLLSSKTVVARMVSSGDSGMHVGVENFSKGLTTPTSLVAMVSAITVGDLRVGLLAMTMVFGTPI